MISLINAPCNGLTGKKIVRKIITIANDLKITNIELQDQSYINFKDERLKSLNQTHDQEQIINILTRKNEELVKIIDNNN